MSFIFDSSAVFKAIKENIVEAIAGNYTLELVRYELGNILWKEHVLHGRITVVELRKLIGLVKKVFSIAEILEVGCREEEIMDVAEKLKLTFYDASFIFYAKEKELLLITEDESLASKAKNYVKALKLSNITSYGRHY